MFRDALKTLSFAILHFSVGFGVTYALTGSIAIASGVALIEPAVNTVVFFLHERAWQAFDRLRISWRAGCARLTAPGGRADRWQGEWSGRGSSPSTDTAKLV